MDRLLERMRLALETTAVAAFVALVAVVATKVGIPPLAAVLGAMYLVGAALLFAPLDRWPDAPLYGSFTLILAGVVVGVLLSMSLDGSGEGPGVAAQILAIAVALVVAAPTWFAVRFGWKRWKTAFERSTRRPWVRLRRSRP